MYNKNKKVKTVVIYSADIKDVVTFVDMGTIKYEVQAFYMKNLNGDENKKFDKLSDEYKIKLRALSEETIDIMTINIFEMKDIKEIEKYF